MGAGLQPGEYKVTFALYRDAKSGATIGGSEKPDERGAAAKQVVAPPYDDHSSQSTTPVTFTVKGGENAFNYDVPAAK